MTEEEKQAYFAKQRKEAEDRSTIRTMEQFIKECRSAGISEEWYGFNCGRSRPVSIEENMVLYGKIGKTLVSYPFQMWDIAFEELLKYKREYEAFICSGTELRIDNVKWTSDTGIIASYGRKYPYVTIRHSDFSETPDQSLIDDGWIFDKYDHYMGCSNYHKTVNIDRLNGKIVVEFTKLTDKRDKEEFGFTDAFMRGSYSYPVPEDMKERINICVCNKRDFPVTMPVILRRELIRRFERSLIEDEFSTLIRLRKDHLSALLGAVDNGLSVKDQKTAFADAGRGVELKNPASDNYFGSRSYVITHRNFDIAYEKAGISR